MAIYLNDQVITTSVLTTEINVQPDISAVTSDIEWNDEWEERGLEGTKYDIVVGDDKAPLLSVEVTVINKSATTPCTVDWGDGYVETSLNTTAAQKMFHKYDTAGHYVLTVSDNVTYLYFMSSVPAVNSVENQITFNTRFAVRGLIQIGSHVTNMYACMCECIWANSPEGGYPRQLPPIPPNVINLNNAFTNLMYYRGQIPRIDHLQKCAGFNKAFFGLEHAEFDMQKFPASATNIGSAYANCKKVTYIPIDIFANCTDKVYDCSSCFSGCTSVKSNYPIISNLTNVTSFGGLFANCYGLGNGTELPELPYASKVTSISNMFQNNYCCTGKRALKIAEHFPAIKSMAYAFQECRELEIPIEIPSTITNKDGLLQTFTNCIKMTGTFPTIPSGYTGSMYQTFYNCQRLTGQITPIPSGVTRLTNAYSYCYGVTGKFPDLNNLNSLAATDALKSIFAYCTEVTGEPENFLDPSKLNSTVVNSFDCMFQGCNNMTSFSHDLSGFTKITTAQSMFRECYNLKTCTMTVPPNVTSMSYMFYYCHNLNENVMQWPTKVATAISTYQFCIMIKPMLKTDGSGATETDNTKITPTRITSSSGCVGSADFVVQKQFWDSCIASGKSGGAYGSVNVTWL